MNQIKKIVIIYATLLVFGSIIAISYHNDILDDDIVIGEKVFGFTQTKLVNMKHTTLFEIMADIENYPQILKDNFISVKILNKTSLGIDDTIFAEQKVTQSGVITTLQTKHSFFKDTIHKIEVINGDAKGTELSVNFEPNGNSTLLTVEAKIRVSGILAPFGFLVQSNLESALNTIIDQFIEYAENKN